MTFAAHMLCAYCGRSCASRSLFSGYEVSGDVTFERHLNQYHVIRLDISGLNECLPELVRKAGTQMVFVIDEWDAVMCQL